MGVHQSNAGLGPSVCGIAARHDQGEVAALPLGEGKLNPKHGKRLEEARTGRLDLGIGVFDRGTVSGLAS
jgi:hypothetical protein